MKAVVFTLGCKVNECESDSLISGLTDLGYQVTDKLEKADLYIVNTCAVTGEAEKKSRQTYARIRKLSPSARIIYTGCAVQKNPKSFKEKNAWIINGAFGKQKILDVLEKSGSYLFPPEKDFEELLPVKSLRKRTYVKVQDGCNNFCTYCIIPHLRGRSRSRNPQSIINEIRAVKPLETVINGINLSAYNFNGVDLAGLIERLKDEDTRIRLGSLEVNVIDERLLTALSKLKNFAPHFHLSLQSGSNAVLKKMNRHYTAEEYLEKVKLIRKYFSLAGITTDVIAGFPTETDQDFNETLDLIKKVEFSDIHPFAFSAREGTPAYKMQDLNGAVKKDRLNRLLSLKSKLKLAFVEKMKGKTLTAIIEESKNGYYQGYTENYLRVYLKEKPSSDVVNVKIIKPFEDGALCE